MEKPRKKHSTIRGFFTSCFRIFLVSYLCIAIIAFLFAGKLMFPYDDCSYDRSLPGLIMLEADDQTPIAARLWSKDGSDTLVLLFHGNFEDLGQLDIVSKGIMNLGFSVLSIDYRGYGLSEGTPNEQNCYEDARLLIQQAQALGYEDSDIILWGRSIGSGPATQLATEINARALVLESPFISAFRTTTHIPLLPFDRFNNLSKMSEVTSPLLIIHGKRDRIIPAWHSSKLIEKHSRRNALHLVDGAGHNNLWISDISPAFRHLNRIIGRKN